jgi:hypothetical protein
MIAAVVLSAVLGISQAAEPESPPTIRRAVPMASLQIPDELAPAVLPYMGCLMARDGTDVRGSFDPRPRGVERGGDCTPYRLQAAQRADAILRQIGSRSADERRVYVEQTLTSIEAFQAASATPPAQSSIDAQD